MKSEISRQTDALGEYADADRVRLAKPGGLITVFALIVPLKVG
jgi:hypothetical protein